MREWFDNDIVEKKSLSLKDHKLRAFIMKNEMQIAREE